MASNNGYSSASVLKSSLNGCSLPTAYSCITDWQSVSLGVEHPLALMTRYLLLCDSYGFVSVGRPLWRENGSVFCICCWPLPAQSFSGPSPNVFAESLASKERLFWFCYSGFRASCQSMIPFSSDWGQYVSQTTRPPYSASAIRV
jgi:hypothetical protein